MKNVKPPDPPNLTPMIDIVFQIIIFFVLTVDLDKEKISDETTLPDAPHGKAVEEAEPATVAIEVNRHGEVLLGGKRMANMNTLRSILNDTRKRFNQSIPIVIYGSKETRHSDIKKVLDACSSVGLWRISFAAIQEGASAP